MAKKKRPPGGNGVENSRQEVQLDMGVTQNTAADMEAAAVLSCTKEESIPNDIPTPIEEVDAAPMDGQVSFLQWHGENEATAHVVEVDGVNSQTQVMRPVKWLDQDPQDEGWYWQKKREEQGEKPARGDGGRAFALVAYVGPFGAILALLCRWKNQLARFHGIQSLLLWCIVIFVGLLLDGTGFFHAIGLVTNPWLQIFYGTILFLMVLVVFSAFAYGILGALMEMPSPLPILGDLVLYLCGYGEKEKPYWEEMDAETRMEWEEAMMDGAYSTLEGRPIFSGRRRKGLFSAIWNKKPKEADGKMGPASYPAEAAMESLDGVEPVIMEEALAGGEKKRKVPFAFLQKEKNPS
ncbi:YwaF family protein [Eubacteriales bacterium OttesenSCG-928-M02]|nr:YwaF family protein [Eubacteriales bacterium OttesenSCG-928-M02]